MLNQTSLPMADFYGGRILNFAHRGARLQAPENTIPAFELAADLGADGIEFDVILSRDSTPVVIHDFHVDQTTNGSGPVKEKTFEELRELDAGSHFSGTFAGTPIPELSEVLEAVGQRLLLNIELKSTDASSLLARIVTGEIKRHSLDERVVISSFNPIILRHVRQIAPQMPIGYLYAPGMSFLLSSGILARPIIGKHQARHPHFSMVDEKYMAWARSHSYRVNVWTVNEAADVHRMRDLGVDMVMSDAPDLVRDILQGKS